PEVLAHPRFVRSMNDVEQAAARVGAKIVKALFHPVGHPQSMASHAFPPGHTVDDGRLDDRPGARPSSSTGTTPAAMGTPWAGHIASNVPSPSTQTDSSHWPAYSGCSRTISPWMLAPEKPIWSYTQSEIPS